jgi:hypothetical protein
MRCKVKTGFSCKRNFLTASPSLELTFAFHEKITVADIILDLNAQYV